MLSLCIFLVTVFCGLYLTTESKTRFNAWLYTACGADETYKNVSDIYALSAQWAQIDHEGRLRLWRYDCGYDLDRAVEIKKYSQEQYLTVLSDCDHIQGFRVLIESGELTEQFVTDTQDFLRETGWTGVDVDFECFWSWTSGDMQHFAVFLELFVDAMHDAGYKVHVALNPKISESRGAPHLDYAMLSHLDVDLWEIMTYDYMYELDPGKYAPIQDMNWARNSYKYAVGVFGEDRVSLGIPSYGYYGVCDTPVVTPQVFSGYHAAEFMAEIGDKRDSRSKELYWRRGDHCYWFSDQDAMDAKRESLEEIGATQFSVWSLGGGNHWFSQ